MIRYATGYVATIRTPLYVMSVTIDSAALNNVGDSDFDCSDDDEAAVPVVKGDGASLYIHKWNLVLRPGTTGRR